MRPSEALHCRKANQVKIELMNTLKINNRLVNKKNLKTKKKRFNETVYTYDSHQKAVFKCALARMGISQLNYVMITVNCPEYIDIKDKQSQLAFLIAFLNSFNFCYIASCEWSDERANGYHLHIIISREDLDLNLNLFSDDTCHISELLVDNSLDRCLGYITKERKGCTASNRKEKFYFSNIPERRLKPLAVRSKITEEPIVFEKEDYQVFKERIKVNNTKEILKSFFENALKEVKRFFSKLFIYKKTGLINGDQSQNICQNTRDGPFGWWETKKDRWSC